MCRTNVRNRSNHEWLLAETEELTGIEAGMMALQSIRNELMEPEVDAVTAGIPYVNATALTRYRKNLEAALDDLAVRTGNRVAAAGRVLPRLKRA
jgi:hypothetical protein